jgi:hypothetical protein
MAIAGIRVVFKAATVGGGEQSLAASHLSIATLAITDALLGLALGMITMQRWVLWRRAKALDAVGHS